MLKVWIQKYALIVARTRPERTSQVTIRFDKPTDHEDSWVPAEIEMGDTDGEGSVSGVVSKVVDETD